MNNKTSIGKLIEQEVRKQNMDITEFAKKIFCVRENAYDIFKRCDMSIEQLKKISKVLNRNFFQEIAKDMEIITEIEETPEEKYKKEIVSQFYDIVPKVLKELNKNTAIIFDKEEDFPVPDYALPGYFISFTIGETYKERLGEDIPFLLIETITSERGIEIELIKNVIFGSTFINIKIENKTYEEWYEIIKFAFEMADQI